MLKNDRLVEQLAAIAAIVLLIVGCLYILAPFFGPLLWAAIISYCTWDLYEHQVKLLRGRRVISALAMTLLVLLVVVGPFAYAAVALRPGMKGELLPRLAAVAAALSLFFVPLSLRFIQVPPGGELLWHRDGVMASVSVVRNGGRSSSMCACMPATTACTIVSKAELSRTRSMRANARRQCGSTSVGAARTLSVKYASNTGMSRNTQPGWSKRPSSTAASSPSVTYW